MGRQIFAAFAALIGIQVLAIGLFLALPADRPVARAADRPVAAVGVQLTPTERVQATTELMIEYRSQRATDNVAAPISCEALLEMIQAAQAVYAEQCPLL
jgi:hypothetical protein